MWCMRMSDLVDVIIIGGSHAGLAAALSLGRATRDVLIIDDGKPCNQQTPRAHNFITQDGSAPADILATAKNQVLKYPTVKFIDGKAVDANQKDNLFEVHTSNNQKFTAKKLLFSTGLTDKMPDIAGFQECWGISILHCPFCHGYEFGNQKTGLLANGVIAYEYLKTINNWTDDITIFTNGKALFHADQLAKIREKNISIIESEIEFINHENGQIKNITFKDKTTFELKALYVRPHFEQQCELPEKLGCTINEHGLFDADIFQKSCVPGVFVAGDNSTVGRSVSVSVAAGAIAGMFITKEIIEEEF